MPQAKSKPVPSVASKTYHDSGSGHTVCWHAYYDEDAEEFKTVGHDKGSECPETTEPPEEHQILWDERRARRSEAKKEIRNLFDRLKRPSKCPVCDSNTVRSVGNEWVRRQIHRCADYETPDSVYFCTECEVNIWKSVGNTQASICIGTDAIDSGSDVRLSKSFSISNHSSARKRRWLEGPESFEEELQQFRDGLDEIRSEVA